MTTNAFFNEFVQRQISNAGNQTPATLNLVHGTTAFKLRAILNEGKIVPNECEILNENVIFTFYARPSYRSKNADQPLYRPLNAPVYIIFDSNVLTTAVTAFPFDTGAFGYGFLRRFVPEELGLKDFSFEPSDKALRALVECYFESNERYLLNSPLAIPNIAEDAFEATTLASVLQRKNTDDPLDDRASTFEIGLGREVEFSVENIKAVILPQSLADGPDIAGLLKEMGIPIHFYDFVEGFSWNQYAALILALIKRYYKDNGKL